MAIPEQRDLIKAREIVRDWLAAKLPDVSGLELSELSGPAFTGFSNETLMFDASWTENGEARTAGYVIRVQPTAHTIFLESDFDVQFKVMRALAENTDVPLPPVLWWEDDESVLGAPFFVMGKVEGRVPSDNPPYTQVGWVIDEATPEFRERMVYTGLDAMAKIHNADWQAMGLEYLHKPQYGAMGLDQQLGYYVKSFEWAAGALGQPQPVAEPGLQWCLDNRPKEEDIRISWGDARINNEIFDPQGNCIAVLDWEMVTLADPMMDFSWWLFLDRHFHEGMEDAPRLPGFPTREQMTEHYAAVSGRTPENVEYYEIFAALRFAVVMMRVTAMVIEFEWMPPDTDMGYNNIPTRLLAQMLGLPAPG